MAKFTIYELDESIGNVLDALDNLVDMETGEITDEEQFNLLRNELDALSEARDTKISNIACWIKQLESDAEAIKKEKMKLASRQKACENKLQSLKQYLSYVLDGNKFKDARVSIYYKSTKSVEFAPDYNYFNLPEQYQKITVEPRKTEIAKAIEAGEEINGVQLVEKNSIVIR